MSKRAEISKVTYIMQLTLSMQKMGKEMLRISDQNKDALCPRQYLIVHSFWSSEKYVSFRKTVLLLWANIYKLCMVDEKKINGQKLLKIESENGQACI